MFHSVISALKGTALLPSFSVIFKAQTYITMNHILNEISNVFQCSENLSFTKL